MENKDAENAIDTITGIIDDLEKEVEMKMETIGDLHERIGELEEELDSIKSRFELD